LRTQTSGGAPILTAEPCPETRRSAPGTTPATVTVEEVGRLLRCGESTVRRLIRTTVLRPVEVDGTVRVRSSDVEAYRESCAKLAARKREQ
jgi:excisionase family DNA binding protein